MKSALDVSIGLGSIPKGRERHFHQFTEVLTTHQEIVLFFKEYIYIYFFLHALLLPLPCLMKQVGVSCHIEVCSVVYSSRGKEALCRL